MQFPNLSSGELGVSWYFNSFRILVKPAFKLFTAFVVKSSDTKKDKIKDKTCIRFISPSSHGFLTDTMIHRGVNKDAEAPILFHSTTWSV